MAHFHKALAALAVASAVTGAAAAISPPGLAVEFYHLNLDDYRLAYDAAELAELDDGEAGAGWVRTGWALEVYGWNLEGVDCPPGGCGERLARFPEFRGWAPDAAGSCGARAPVRRFQRAGGERFVGDVDEGVRMRGLGWSDDGVQWCAAGVRQLPIRAFELQLTPQAPLPERLRCDPWSPKPGPCMGFNNLVMPQAMLGFREAFGWKTGLRAAATLAHEIPGLEPGEDVFVQPDGPRIGIHVETRYRGGAILSSVNPLFQLSTAAPAEGRDRRFFPFADSESPVEMRVAFGLNVKRLELRGTASAAYGHPTLEFVDVRSERPLYFTVQTYGTVPPHPLVARDPGTGWVIVSAVFGAPSPFGRTMGSAFLETPAPFEAGNPVGSGGPFDYRMDAHEFEEVLAAARTIEPALSADPRDYLLRNFHFNNEVVGDGAIGLYLDGYRLEMALRR